MKTDRELIKNIRKLWLYSIFELSHLEFQQKAWVEVSMPNVVSSFTEVACCYYDDLDLGSGYKNFILEGFISDEEFEMVSAAHNLFSDYISRTEKKSLSDAKVLLDPDWHRVVEAMFSAWQALKDLVNEDEQGYMDEIESKLKDVRN